MTYAEALAALENMRDLTYSEAEAISLIAGARCGTCMWQVREPTNWCHRPGPHGACDAPDDFGCVNWAARSG